MPSLRLIWTVSETLVVPCKVARSTHPILILVSPTSRSLKPDALDCDDPAQEGARPMMRTASRVSNSADVRALTVRRSACGYFFTNLRQRGAHTVAARARRCGEGGGPSRR